MSNQQSVNSFENGLLVGLVVAGLLAYLAGLAVGGNSVERTAIEQGVARWTVNPTNGVTTLEWGAGE